MECISAIASTLRAGFLKTGVCVKDNEESFSTYEFQVEALF